MIMEGKQFVAVALDGPSGAGKSTVARAVAKERGYLYVDTGAIYRTLGLAVQRAGLDSKDSAGILALLPEVHIDIAYGADGAQRMLLGGEDVSDEIRTPRSARYASDVSTLPEVRAFLLNMQRNLAKTHDVIMDGRDIGTVVLPDAQVKIFLTASAEERAKRRWLELKERGTEADYAQVLRDIVYRDEQDSSRASAPLRPAEDAAILDTGNMTFSESVSAVCALIDRALSV